MPEMLTHIRVMQANRTAARAYSQAKKKVEDLFATLEVNDGDRIRFSGPDTDESYVIEARGRSGGGITVPEWSKVTAGKVTKL